MQDLEIHTYRINPHEIAKNISYTMQENKVNC